MKASASRLVLNFLYFAPVNPFTCSSQSLQAEYIPGVRPVWTA